MEVETLSPVEAAPCKPGAPTEQEPVDSRESLLSKSRKPPSDGPCKMCGEAKPINRLMLCYQCWLKDKLHKDSGGAWLPGDPHPAGCGCDAPGGCATKGQAN